MIMFIAGIVALNVVILVEKNGQKFTDDITVEVSDTKAKTVNVTLTEFLPGESKSKKITLKNESENEYSLKLKFEKTGEDSLAPFIDVVVKIGGEQQPAKTLKELFASDAIPFKMTNVHGAELEIEVIYSMSLDVGDEAQRTKADFDILIYAE